MVWSDCQHFSFIFLRIRGRDWFSCALPSAQFVSSLASYIVLYIIYRKDRTCQSKQGKAIPPPFPAATMSCRLIRPFGPPSPQGEGFDCAVSLALPLAISQLYLSCVPPTPRISYHFSSFPKHVKAWYNWNQQTIKSALLAARRMT